MSFVRDKDAATRGVNAVAAFDMTSRRGRALEARKQRLMMQRDRAMSAVAKGALRGMGAIDANKIGAGTLRLPVISGGGGGGVAPPIEGSRTPLGVRAP